MRVAAVFVVVLATVVLVSCGGSKSESDASDADTGDNGSATTETTETTAPPTTEATGGVLEGTYQLTGPAPGLYECSFAEERLLMTVGGDQVTIDESDGLISGTITPQGDVIVLDAIQPDNYINYTITITVTDGGDAFTATAEEESKLGGCSFEFSGTRTDAQASTGSEGTGGSTSTTAGSSGGSGTGTATCDDSTLSGVVTDAYPGTATEVGNCEGGWAVVAWWYPGQEGSDSASVLHFDGGEWQIYEGNVCTSDEQLPTTVYLAACQSG